MGINLNYAPCCDVNVNPQNPVVGTRSFGEDPEEVARLSAAMVAGIQSCGVVATAKHFPGHGDTVSDSHHGIPVVPHSLERLRSVEFPPFLSSIQAGAKAVMTAHLALPAIDGRADLPATLSPSILKGLLRQELGFTGVIVTDAMDMQAIRQGEALGREAVAAVAAGADLLLLGSRPADQSYAYAGLVQALREGVLDSGDAIASAGRVSALKGWLADQGPQLDLDVVGCAAHRATAREIAERSITLVRDRACLLPLRPQAGQRLAVILPQPTDLTPADTSSYVVPRLAEALRAFHTDVDEFAIPYAPQGSDISAILDGVRHHDFVIVGTLNAASQPGQAALVRGLLDRELRTIVVALRMPYDLMAFPEAPTYLCTYSILEPPMHALARALWGQIDIQGRLPVSIPGLYSCGYCDTPD
jgi:beta-N-acetylhexosaminidase